MAVFNAFALRLNEDWLTQFSRKAKLDTTEANIIASYVLPSLQFSADEYDARLTAFFNESIAVPIAARAERPEAILKNSEPNLAAILKELPVPTVSGR